MPGRRVGDMTTSTASYNTRVGGGLVLYCISIAASLLITQTYRERERERERETHTTQRTRTKHGRLAWAARRGKSDRDRQKHTYIHTYIIHTHPIHPSIHPSTHPPIHTYIHTYTYTHTHQAYTKHKTGNPGHYTDINWLRQSARSGHHSDVSSHIHTYNAEKSGWGCWGGLARIWRRPLSGLLHCCSLEVRTLSLSLPGSLWAGVCGRCCKCCKFVFRSSKAKARPLEYPTSGHRTSRWPRRATPIIT
ncbi:hypothetical protein F4803DRAFT_412200 [Xylaria telfairii]|nr:hypothetical protein F4803DRAFT_412200 [Xylaria telfairii]